MAADPWTIDLRASAELAATERAAIIALCGEAFAEDFAAMFTLLPDAQHLLLCVEGDLIGHACWVTRWLQPAQMPLLCAAYIEAVAVLPVRQGEGWGSILMRRVAEEITTYDLGALSPATVAFYERLGWVEWKGPMAIRQDTGLLDTPDEGLMILRTPHTPTLDLTALITAEWREGELW